MFKYIILISGILFTIGIAQDIPPNPDFWKLDRPFWDIKLYEQPKVLYKPLTDEPLNPFIQPNLRADPFDYHGSGDGDGDGQITSNDQQMIGSHVLTDYRLDVNGDGVVNNDDKNIIGKYLSGEIDYLPAWWNELKARDERVNWFQKMANIYAIGERQGYEDRHYATEFFLLTHGIEDTVKLHSKYDGIELGLANVPTYYIFMMAVDSSGGPLGGVHLNAIFVGDDLLNYNDWIFYNPKENTLVDLVNTQFYNNSDYTILQIFRIKNFYWNGQVHDNPYSCYPLQQSIVGFHSDTELGYYNSSCWSNMIMERIYILNPYQQPNIIYDQLNCHGGGDYDGLGIGVGDQQAAQSQINDFRLDVSGDNVITQEDANIIGDCINNTIEHLPSWWNFIQTRQEKEDWFWKMANIYTVDQKPYIDADDLEQRYDCSQFAAEFLLRMNGANYNREFWGFDYSKNGKANIPVFHVTLIGIDHSLAHALNAVLIGENPLEFNDWLIYEPQTNNVSGITSLQTNLYVTIRRGDRIDYNFCRYDNNNNLVQYKIENESVDLLYYSENLILEKPTLDIKRTNDIPKSFSLEQNYPNPFNATTKIIYTLNKENTIALKIFDIRGRELEILVNKKQKAGEYSINWNSTNYASGIYFYQLKVGDIVKTRKMLLLR